MKRFLLFAGDKYHPQGGMNDLVNSYYEVELALEAAANIHCEWWHIYDTLNDKAELVRSGTR